MSGKSVSAYVPDDLYDGLSDLAEDRDLKNTQGEISQGKALTHAARRGATEMGYGDYATDGGAKQVPLLWALALLCIGAAIGFLYTMATLAVGTEYIPHAIGFLLAAIVALVYEQTRDSPVLPIGGGS